MPSLILPSEIASGSAAKANGIDVSCYPHARTSESLFPGFIEPLLRTAAIWIPSGDPDLGFGTWQAMAPSEAPAVRKWIHRELLTYAFLLDLTVCDFSFAQAVTPYLAEMHEAFKALLSGQARIAAVDGMPAISGLGITPRTLLTSAKTRNLNVFSGDPVSLLHAFIRGAANKTRTHTQPEIEALIKWADEEFVTRVIEMFQTPPSGDPGKPYKFPSNAVTNAESLVYVVLGHNGVEWSVDGPIFTPGRKTLSPAEVLRKRSKKKTSV